MSAERLLFIAPVETESHETAIGVALAQQLVGNGFEVYFLIDPYNAQLLDRSGLKYSLVSTNMETSVEKVVEVTVRSFQPTAIILSDYVAYWMTLTMSYDVDPWFVDQFDLPILPIDLYELDQSSLRVEVKGALVDISDRILDMPAHLRPAPTSRTLHNSTRGFVYRAYQRHQWTTRISRDTDRAELGLSVDDKLLVIPALDPQHAMTRRGTGHTSQLAARVPELIVSYLLDLPAVTHFAILGPNFSAYSKLPQDRVHHVAGWEIARVLGAADGIWSTYFPAAEIEYSLMMDVPSMLSINGGISDRPSHSSERIDAWRSQFADPVGEFILWPWGWVDLLAPLLENNPFMETMLRSELLDNSAVEDGLNNLLFNSDERARLSEMRDSYRNLLMDLPPTAQVVKDALRKARAVRG